MIPYGQYEDFSNVFRLFLYPARNLSLLHRMEKLTRVPQSCINAEEAVPLLLRDQTDIPGCDEAVWKLANPKTIDDIIKVFALSSPHALRSDNWETLVQKEIIPFSEMIGSYDDIFCRLLDSGLNHAFARQVVERIQNGRGLDEECASILMENKVPEWFIHSCNDILYLFPKAHSAAVGAIPALKAAWYKAHFPKEYDSIFSVNS